MLGMNSRACKAGALPAELHAPCNCMILKMILIEFRENDYLPSRQVLSQAELQAQRVQPSADQILTAISGSEQNVSCRFWALCSLLKVSGASSLLHKYLPEGHFVPPEKNNFAVIFLSNKLRRWAEHSVLDRRVPESEG